MQNGKWGQTGLRRVGRLANRLLGQFNVRIAADGVMVAKGVARPWHHPSSPDILHKKALPGATYSPWLNDADFGSCYELIRENTMVDVYRCYELWQLGRQMASIPGNFLEVGVWRGGTGCLLANSVRNSGKVIYLADTFSGVVKTSDRDTAYSDGQHADTSEAVVEQLAKRLGLTNVRILKGMFPEDTAHSIGGPIALLHCDVDVYASAKEVVEWALPLISHGGVIVFDDYGFSGCEGITRFVNEIRDAGHFFFVHNLNGHAILLKR
jgi:O-methyltransferase